MTDTLLTISNLSTHLGSRDRPVRVVEGVDMEIRRGETFALLGESGCGKSMLALSLMRLLPPSGQVVAGAVLMSPQAGGDMWERRLGATGPVAEPSRRGRRPDDDLALGEIDLLQLPEHAMRQVRGGRMAMIFQEPQTSLNPVLTIGAQIAEAVRIHQGRARAQVQGRVLELLREVGIPDPERRVTEYPHQLSGGMKQRVMIAMALAGDPEILIADEPTTALDVTIQAQVLRLLKRLQAETGMAVLLITHDLGVVAETADRLAVMYAGQIVETATAADFFAGPAHPYSRRLMESVPTPGRRSEPLAVIPGRVPPLDHPFPGCRFADRCHLALPRCASVEPAWFGAGSDHDVRCHLWAEGTPAFANGPVAAPTDPPDGAETGDGLLKVTGLKVHFPIQGGILRRVAGWVRAVDGVSLTLRSGRTLALVGESGCGKTTVGKGILQLLRPTAGSVEYQGLELAILSDRRLRPHRKDLQIIFQDPVASMNPRMLVGDIVGEGLQALGLEPNRTSRQRRVASLLEAVGMPPEAANLYPHEFSGGQRQRICIARALAVKPKVIVCDEPTSALDVSVQAQVLNLLKALQDERGLAYLFITHNLSVVSYLAHEVAVMYLGRIVEYGTVSEVLEDPRHPYTKALLSAVPQADPDSRREIIRLEGDMPSPANPPSGCHFHPRCPEAGPQCALAYPEELRLGPSRGVHCLRGNQSAPSPPRSVL
jgi:peptide/nickel transport system ATP-binding protein